MGESNESITVVLCYAHEDKALCGELEKHLSSLIRERLISLKHGLLNINNTQGTDRQSERDSIILLLISPDFLASDHHHGVEMRYAIERYNAGTAYIIPVLLRPTDWQETSLGALQALPSEGRPITSWPDRDEAFLHVVQSIRVAVAALRPSVVLISSPHDEPFAVRLTNDLKANGIAVLTYLEKTEQDSSEALEAIRTGLRRASAVLLIASPDARKSRFVKKQLDIAAFYQRERLLIWSEGDSWEESIPEEWSGDREVFDARGVRYEEALGEILTRLRPPLSLHFLVERLQAANRSNRASG